MRTNGLTESAGSKRNRKGDKRPTDRPTNPEPQEPARTDGSSCDCACVRMHGNLNAYRHYATGPTSARAFSLSLLLNAIILSLALTGDGFAVLVMCVMSSLVHLVDSSLFFAASTLFADGLKLLDVDSVVVEEELLVIVLELDPNPLSGEALTLTSMFFLGRITVEESLMYLCDSLPFASR